MVLKLLTKGSVFLKSLHLRQNSNRKCVPSKKHKKKKKKNGDTDVPHKRFTVCLCATVSLSNKCNSFMAGLECDLFSHCQIVIVEGSHRWL